MTHDYKEALDTLDKVKSVNQLPCQEEIDKTSAAIRHALRIADRLMQEPSTRMKRYGIDAYNDSFTGIDDVFKAMRDQMLSEIQLTQLPENVSYENLTNAADTSQNTEWE